MPFDYQPSVEVRACNLCGRSEFQTVQATDRYGFPIGLSRCSHCGLRFLNPRMTDAGYAEFYRSGVYRDLISRLAGRKYGVDEMEPAQKRYAKDISAMLRPHLSWHKTLLDIGGSTGVVSERMMLDHDLHCTVLEPSQAEADRARERGLEVVQDVLHSGAVGGKYDVVLLCQTVEHLTDIAEGMGLISELISPGGLFFVDIVRGSRPKIDHCYYLGSVTAQAYLAMAGLVTQDTFTASHGKRLYFVASNPWWNDAVARGESGLIMQPDSSWAS